MKEPTEKFEQVKSNCQNCEYFIQFPKRRKLFGKYCELYLMKKYLSKLSYIEDDEDYICCDYQKTNKWDSVNGAY